MTMSAISRRSPAICANQESQIRRLTGISGGTEFLLVRATDSRSARCRPRRLCSARLTSAAQDGAIRGFQSLAQFVPSVARQRDNRALVHDKLMAPYLASYYQRLGMTGRRAGDDDKAGFLTPDAISDDSPLSFLRNLILESDASGATDRRFAHRRRAARRNSPYRRSGPGRPIRRSDRRRDAVARRVSPARDDSDRRLGAVDDAGADLALWSARQSSA